MCGVPSQEGKSFSSDQIPAADLTGRTLLVSLTIRPHSLIEPDQSPQFDDWNIAFMDPLIDRSWLYLKPIRQLIHR